MAERGGLPAGAPAGALPAGPAGTPAGLLARTAGPVVSARTWLSFIHLLAGPVTGALACCGFVVLGALGLSTLWFFLIGLQLIAGLLWLVGWFAQAERARFAVMLGEHIPEPPAELSPGTSAWRRVWQRLASQPGRRQIGYVLIRLPLGALEAGLVVAVWSFALAMLGLPLFGWLLLRYGWQVSAPVPGNAAELAALSALGLVLLFAAPRLTQGVAAVDTAVARYLIGPGSQADLTVRIGELERSRARVVDAAEAERRRIERDLHDGAQQRLVSLAMNLGRAKARFDDDPEATRAIIGQAHADAKKALADLRNLVRGVHPPVLTDRGLDAAVSGLAALSPVPVTVRAADLARRPPATVEAIAYFVVAEALTNVAKHARAAHTEVVIGRHGDVLRVTVRDDGRGGADRRGQGLSGLADRVAGVDGRLSVFSPPGGPTVIEVELPCGS
jgi:signal transduction histidine kinase